MIPGQLRAFKGLLEGRTEGQTLRGKGYSGAPASMRRESILPAGEAGLRRGALRLPAVLMQMLPRGYLSAGGVSEGRSGVADAFSTACASA
jgi:hypothetical protein